MEIDSEVWVKGKESKKNSQDGLWMVGRVISKNVNDGGIMTLVVRASDGNEFTFSSKKGGLDMENVQLKNVDSGCDLDNLIELPYLNEPEILQSLSTRYFERKIYTYTGNILIAINPRHAIIPENSCETFLRAFAADVKTVAVGLDGLASGSSSHYDGEIRRHSIIISGESGSGKTEVAKQLTMFLISADVKSARDFLGVKVIQDDGDTSDEDEFTSSKTGKFPHSISQDSLLCATPTNRSMKEDYGSPSPFDLSLSAKHPEFAPSPTKTGYFKAYQLSTMERIRQVTPIIEAFGNACIAHTHNSSRLGKYSELSFSKRGDLVGGEIRTYLLENVRVTRQLEHERNFHIFYQIAAGATDLEKSRWAVGDIANFHYTNQGGAAAMKNPVVDDAKGYTDLRENFNSLGFSDSIIEKVLQVVAGILHLGEISFTFKTALEGQVAQIIEKFVTAGDTSETVLSAAARLCSLSGEELERCLTVRSVLLNKELFHKSLTPQQALSARDAVAKAVYKRLFAWLVQELNEKLRPTQNVPAVVTSCVGILDIFGFDSFAVNSFEQLCINYANEALQQHFAQHMFKLELEEYKREGIAFENIEFPDNQDSLDLITNGVFTILDDQCRIPNPTDKRYASQLYKELTVYSKFSANATQVSANQFCVYHFAGPVVYDSDKFIEKNLDELPQDAAELLKKSSNPVLTLEMPGLGAGAGAFAEFGGPPRAPTMHAYVSNTKVEPGSRLPGAPSRRGSLAGKGVPYSVVAQLRSEVAVMMAHINMTVPHYVCCINPVDRLHSVHSEHATQIHTRTDTSAKYQSHIVAAQLRYGGILGAVKVARSGLPHRFTFVDFFQRYRCIANPLHPVYSKLAVTITDRNGDSEVKEQCEQLIRALSNVSGKPLVVSAIQSRLMNEMRAIFRKRSVRHWMGSIGGVISEGGAQVGLTKVFLAKQAHTLLESCLYHQHALCRSKIGGLLLRYISRRRLKQTMRAIALIQRVMRGALARCSARLARKHAQEGEIVKSSESSRNELEVKDRYHSTKLENEVREVKRQDAVITDQIKRMVASNKAVEGPEILSIDFTSTKSDLVSYAARFPSASVINVKTIEASDVVGEGYQLLRPEKLIPVNAVSKALSFGFSAKTENRSSSVKSANKVINKDHALFKNLHKLMDRLRELFELSKLEKEVLDQRKRGQRRSSITPVDSARSTPTHDTDIGDIEVKMGTLDKIAKLARSIYQYYHQYILEFVKEYGVDSKYRSNFGDDNKYLLALVALVEARVPLLACEKMVKESEEIAAAKAANNFPLYIPSERQQGPQHQGYYPLCTQGEVHFKVLPPSHAPGVEYSINVMQLLLKGRLIMYPIKYLKLVGKSGESKGKELFYQAATEFGAQNLATMDRAAVPRVCMEDFSTLFLTSIVFGAKVMHPQNVMAEPSKEYEDEARLMGVNCDDSFLSNLFRFRPSDAQNTDDLNILYMMPQMDSAVSPSVLSILTQPGAAARITSTWLRELSMQNKRCAGLKSAGFVPADLAMLSLPIVLPPHAGAQVQHMLVKLSKVFLEAEGAGASLTHSDVLAALEPTLANRYAELRIRISSSANKSYFDVYKACLSERAETLKADPQIKRTFTMDVDHMTAEVLNALDFTTLPDKQENFDLYTALFDNFSIIPLLHLRAISESQLQMFFQRLLDWNKEAYITQATLRGNRGLTPPPRPGAKVQPAVRTTVKGISLCGLSGSDAKKLMDSSIVEAIQTELGIKVALDQAAAAASRRK